MQPVPAEVSSSGGPARAPSALTVSFLASASATAGIVHLAMLPPHAADSVVIGAGFALVAWFQVICAVLVVARPSRALLVTMAVGNLAVVGVWALSRTSGLPVGPHADEAEAVALVDLVSTAAAGLVAVIAIVALRPAAPRREREIVSPGAAVAVPAIAAVLLTTTALAAPGGDHTHGGDDHTHELEAAAGHAHADEATAAGDGHDHGTATGATSASDDAHDHTDLGPGHHDCTAPVSAAEQSWGDSFAAATAASTARFEDIAVARAEGYVPITPEASQIVHYGRFDLMSDGILLDPQRIESLMYGRGPDGRTWFLGAMYWNDHQGVAEPTPGGCLTQWHTHTNLCIEPGKGMVGVVRPDGSCPPGSVNEETSSMMHVWTIPLPTGPFTHDASPDEIRAAVRQKFS